MSDRGYRDEIGAAVERLEKLREENAELRAELDRLDAPKRRSARARFAGASLLFGAMLAMTLGAFTHGFSCPHRSRAHRHASDQRTQRALDVRARAMAPEFTTVRGGDDCSIPFYYDRNHVKHYKASCLVAPLE